MKKDKNTNTATISVSEHISTAKQRFAEMPQKVKASFRKSDVWGFFVSLAVIAIVSLLFFGPDNFEGNTLAQNDMIQGMSNGHEAQEYEKATGEKALWTNSLFSGMPTFQIAPEYSSNRLFNWINKVYGFGLPAPSNLLFMMMFGFLIMLTCLRLRWWYALIGSLAWGLSSYFIIIIGAGHIWKFVALSYVPPTIGGLIMIYQGRRVAGAAITALFLMMELNANHPQITYYFAFLMAFLVIGFFIRACFKKGLLKWLGSSGVLLCAVILAFGANMPSLYNTYKYSKETKRAASELTPIGGQQQTSSGRPTGGLPKEEIGGWSNLPEESISLLIPNIKGGASVKPGNGGLVRSSLSQNKNFDRSLYNNQILIPYSETQAIPIYDYLTDYFGGKGSTNGPFYVGALIVALFLLGCFIVRGPVKWVLLIATILSILLAMGNHFSALTDFMIYNVPLYNKFRAAETALVIACLCMPLLGMLALQKLFTMPEPLKNRMVVRGLSVAFVFPVFVCLVAWIFPSIFGSGITEQEADMLSTLGQYYGQTEIQNTIDTITSMRYSMISADASRSLVFLILGGALVILALKTRLKKGLACLSLGLLITIDLFSIDKRYVNHDSFSTSFTTYTDAIRPDAADREILQDKSYYRVVDLDGFDDPRRSFFHHNVGGYHAAKLNRYNDVIERIIYPSLRRGTIDNMLPVLDMLNTKYIITHDNTGQSVAYYNEDALGAAWLVDHLNYVDNADEEMMALQIFNPSTEAVADKRFREILGEEQIACSQGDYIKLDKYTPNQLTYTVDTKNGGLAVFSEVWFPWGWNTTIDGKKVELGRVNYILRSLRVPAGKHTVVMTFDPKSIHTTTTIAYIAVTLIYLLCIFAIFLAIVCPGKKEDSELS